MEPGTTITASLAKPAQGNAAAFADLEYEIDGVPYHLTTTFFEPGIKPKRPVTSNP